MTNSTKNLLKMSGRVKKAPAPKKKANGYKMPAPIKAGEVINDTIRKKKWLIGPSIGVGGFGEIYSACDGDKSPKKTSEYPFVIKIEPHENGPIFVEIHFYCRSVNKDDITNFMKSKKISSIGMPAYYGHGSHNYKGEKYRYLVLERYGQNLWSLFTENGRNFPTSTVFQLGIQMLDVLEYIHERGYVHADIKGANILLGLKKGTENQAYLVDFGLATRINDKEFKPNPKAAHNGTIEYTSRDAHLGVPTMRGDLEILGYNMLQWIVGELPWEKSLKQPKAVQDMKEAFMKNVKANIAKLGAVPDALVKFFEYINTLKPKDVPDYNKCRHFFENYLKSEGKNRNSKLEFTPTKSSKGGKRGAKSNSVDKDNEEDAPLEKVKKQNGLVKKATKAGRPRKLDKRSESESIDEDSEEEAPEAKTKKQNGLVKKATKVGRPRSESESCSEEDAPRKKVKRQNGETVKATKVGRPRKIDKESESENCENETPNGSIKTVRKVRNKKNPAKRKSLEPTLVVKLKRTKLTPKATPPLKKTIATQTSGQKRSPKQVQFDSPVSEIIGEEKNSINSSGDIFDDSFVIVEKKVKPKKRLVADEEVTVKRVVKKRVTTVAKRSWKDLPSVANGRSPPS